MNKLALAMFQPWRLWPTLLKDPRDAGWLYVVFAIESLLMRPESATRALWAVGRRGFSSVLSVLQLAATEVIIVMLASYALALLARLVVKPALDMGQIAGILPWAFVPQVGVSALFAVLWSVDLVPGDAMIFAGFRTHQGWALAYHVATYGAVLVSLIAFIRAGEERPTRAFAWAPALLLAVAVGGLLYRVATDPTRFRPVGRGDRVTSLSFASLTDDAPMQLSFPRERPVVIDFWASWCGPCIEGLPDWQTLAADRSINADFVSANVDPAEARAFYVDRGYHFAAHVADSATQTRFQVSTLPTMLVIAPSGEIQEYWIGATSATSVRRALR